jgi:hypothetical protein
VGNRISGIHGCSSGDFLIGLALIHLVFPGTSVLLHIPKHNQGSSKCLTCHGWQCISRIEILTCKPERQPYAPVLVAHGDRFFDKRIGEPEEQNRRNGRDGFPCRTHLE